MRTKLKKPAAASGDRPRTHNVKHPARREPLPLEFPGIHHFDQAEIEAAVRVLKRRSLFRYYGLDACPGEVKAFESEFASYLGISHALAVTSGTAALQVALSALGVGPGQEVIVPAYMWVSVAAAVVNLGAIPVVADINDTFGLDTDDVKKRITDRTAGIIAVHMSGAPADVRPLVKLARERQIFLLEDCAQCVGGSVEEKKIGTFGDMAVFSFQINKNMTSGEGGCVVTNDARLYSRAVACHDAGYVRDKLNQLVFSEPEFCLWGLGSRLDELRGAILRVQLKKLPKIIYRMRASKNRIRERLERLPQVKLRRMIDTKGDTGSFLITIWRDAQTAKKACAGLRREGIVTWPQGTSDIVMTDYGLHIYYNIPSLVHKASNDKRGFPWNLAENSGSQTSYAKGSCPIADDLFERSILLAIPSCLARRDEDRVIHVFEKVCRPAR